MATEGGGLVKRTPQQVQAANLMILQRRDDAVSEILATATYVVIYVFEPVTKQWERKEVSCLLLARQEIQVGRTTKCHT